MSFVKQHKILSIVLTLVIALCLWWVWGQVAPHPLGNGMVYLGKEDYGNIFGFDSAPYSEYYYGTDMSIGDIEKYFNGAQQGYSYATNATVIGFLYKGENFDIYYYANKSDTDFSTNKKHVVSVVDGNYEAAKEAIR